MNKFNEDVSRDKVIYEMERVIHILLSDRGLANNFHVIGALDERGVRWREGVISHIPNLLNLYYRWGREIIEVTDYGIPSDADRILLSLYIVMTRTGSNQIALGRYIKRLCNEDRQSDVVNAVGVLLASRHTWDSPELVDFILRSMGTAAQVGKEICRTNDDILAVAGLFGLTDAELVHPFKIPDTAILDEARQAIPPMAAGMLTREEYESLVLAFAFNRYNLSVNSHYRYAAATIHSVDKGQLLATMIAGLGVGHPDDPRALLAARTFIDGTHRHMRELPLFTYRQDEVDLIHSCLGIRVAQVESQDEAAVYLSSTLLALSIGNGDPIHTVH